MTVRTIVPTFALILILAIFHPPVFAQDAIPEQVPDRYGMATVIGNTYDPKNDITFVQVAGFAQFDYAKFWGHKAPESLRFKVEGALGNTTRPEKRAIVSAHIFAVYYLNGLASKVFKPYVEGGIGAIYTDFKVEGQGLRFNFNPQMGIGTEIGASSDNPFLLSLRLHHISNGGLNHENRGVNSVTLTIGRFF